LKLVIINLPNSSIYHYIYRVTIYWVKNLAPFINRDVC